MDFKDFPLADVGTSIQLVGGIWASEKEAHLFYFPEYGSAYEQLHAMGISKDDWKALLRQSDLLETEVLSKCEDGKLYKAVVRKCQRNIDQQVSWNVFRRDSYTCRYCGRNDVPLTVDHLVLWENGGPSTEANLVSACKKCNKTRGSVEYADWLNHNYYKRVSENLSLRTKQINAAVLATLKDIEPVINIRKKR
jgi:hypothetical protein